MTRSQGPTIFSTSGAVTFKGFIKNGLDSSTLINLIAAFKSSYDEYKKKGFLFPPNIFYYHEISRTEAIGVLINKFNYSKQEAIDGFNELEKNFNLTKIQRVPQLDKPFENLVMQTNQNLAQEDPKLKIGEHDTIIISGFLRENINIAHSDDKGFLRTCEALKINTIPVAKRDKDKEDEIKKWMKKR